MLHLAEQDLANRPSKHPWHDAERLLDRGLELVGLARLRDMKHVGERLALLLAERRKPIWSPSAELGLECARNTQLVSVRVY